MEHNKTPGLDSFNVEFFQNFWDTVTDDLLELFGELHAGQLELLGRLFYSQKLLMSKGFSSSGQFVFSMFALRILLRCLLFD
jgi:hypothetical protein